jgi:hypothetical protein
VRSFRLISIAASAEGVRLRRHIRRFWVRAVLLVVALGFAAATAVLLEMAAGAWIYTRYGGMRAALALGGANLVLAALFAWLALRDAADPVAQQAQAVSRQAQAELEASFGRAALIGGVARLLGRIYRGRSRN